MKLFCSLSVIAISVGMSVAIFTTKEESQFDEVVIAHAEALSDNESKYGNGYTTDFSKTKMCGEYIFYPCTYTGNKNDDCTQPC